MPFYAKAEVMSSDKTGANRNGNRLIDSYFREVAKLTIPTAEQERALFLAYQQAADRNPDEKKSDGPVAAKIKQQIAQGYLRFVIKHALGRTKDENLLLDLIAAGNEGLLVGIKKFDPERKNQNGSPMRFLTYGAWWIRVYIQSALHEAGLGHPPAVQEPPIDWEESGDAEAVRNEYGTVQYLSDPAQLASSDPSADTLLSAAEFNVLQEIREAALTRKEMLILIYYFGLRGGPRQTFGQLSKLLLDLEGSYISSERVRQIKEHALRNLRKALKKKKLTSVSDVF
jgi:RNA polymerase sigma factor (sigma-70 family)